MNPIKLHLTDEEFRSLSKMAEIELRSMPEQARWFIQKALKCAAGDAVDEQIPKRAQLTRTQWHKLIYPWWERAQSQTTSILSDSKEDRETAAMDIEGLADDMERFYLLMVGEHPAAVMERIEEHNQEDRKKCIAS